VADALKIEIDTASAKQALDALRASFQQTVAAAEQFGTRGAAGIKKFGDAMASLKPIDATVASSITAFNNAMQNLKAGAVGSVAAELNKLAKVDVNKVAANVKVLSDALANLKVPPGLDSMAAAFGNLARSAQAAGVAVKAAAPATSSLQKAIGSLNKEILNSVGFMSGLGVSFGNLVTGLQSVMDASGGAINSIGALVGAMGKLPAIAAAAGAAFLVFKGVQAIISNLIQPIIDVTQQFRAFSLALDAMRGAGAGAAGIEQLRGIAARTGSEILALTNNFKQFEASASASGMTAGQSAKIFEQFSGAFSVLGLTSTQASLAFRALTQMMAKGTVQAEELRGQLGENLPGSVQLFAEALGVSTRAMEKMMKSGQVLSADVLPKVAELLNKKYGEALVASLESVVAQVNRLSNTWTFLMKAMGEGDITGVFGGVAQGLKAIADALANSSGLEQFARQLGDLIGLIANSVLTQIAQVIQVLNTLINVFYSVAGAINSVLPSWEQFSNFTSSLVDPLTNAVAALGQLGSAIAQLGFHEIVKPIIDTAKAIADWVANSQAAQAAITLLSAAIKVLINLLGGAVWNFFSQVMGLVAEGAKMATDAIVNFSGGLVQVGSSADTVTAATSASAAALSNFASEAQSASDAIVAAAYGVTSYENAQRDAAQQVEQTEKHIRSMQSSLKDQDASMRQITRQQKDFTDGIRSENQALEREREALQRRQRALQDMAGAEGGIGGDGIQKALDALSDKIKNNSEAIENSNLAFGDRQRIEAEYRDSIQAGIQAEQERNAILKEFGVQLSDSGKEAVAFLTSMGQQKDAAVSLAFAIDQATMSMEKRIEKMQQEAQQAADLGSWADAQIDKIREETDAKLENMRVRGENTEVIDAERRIAEAALTPLDKLRAGAIEEEAALKTVIMARKEGISIQQAATKVSQELANKYGIEVDAAKTVAGAIDQMSQSQEKGKSGAEQLANANQKAGKSIEAQKEDAKQLQSALEGIGTKAEETAGKIAATTETWAAFSEPVKTAGDGMRMLADSFARLTLSLPTVQAGISGLNEVLPTFSGQMKVLSEVAPALGAEFPKFATAIQMLSTSIAAMAETLPAFTNNLRAIGEAGEGAKQLTEAFQALIDMINQSAADIAKAGDVIKSLGAAAASVGAGFDQATASAGPLISAINEVAEAAERAEEAFRKMEDAAKDALAAAKAAAAAGGGGEGGDTPAQREGGYAGDRMQTQHVSMDAFKQAPKFAEGIGNTSAHPSRVPGGGIPSILHPNEAVVPLSRGRKIPVDVKLDMPDFKMPKLDTKDNSEWVRGLDYLTVSIDHLADSVKSLANVEPVQAQTLPKMELPELPSVHDKPEAPEVQHRITPDEAFDPGRTPSGSTRTDRTSPTNTERNAQIINITVHATDADSFKRTQDQIVRELGRKIQRAERRGG
jgi:tape measure domain-containing protein